jgi:hypothetical protein
MSTGRGDTGGRVDYNLLPSVRPMGEKDSGSGRGDGSNLAFDVGDMSEEEVATLFQVGEATVHRWKRLKRETGSLVPRPPRSGGMPPRVTPEQYDLVRAIVSEQPDVTIPEAAWEFHRRTRIRALVEAAGALHPLRLRGSWEVIGAVTPGLRVSGTSLGASSAGPFANVLERPMRLPSPARGMEDWAFSRATRRAWRMLGESSAPSAFLRRDALPVEAR